MVPEHRRQPDYFAELYVAGILADAGWNIYFPHRDRGFDFIIAKLVAGNMLLRPVQVKGKYPTGDKTDKPSYGYIGRLTEIHPEMVLSIPFFAAKSQMNPPLFVAYMPFSLIRRHKRGYRCLPATFQRGEPKRRRDFAQFFDLDGIRRLEDERWKESTVLTQKY
jgi:hypothetical protein